MRNWDKGEPSHHVQLAKCPLYIIPLLYEHMQTPSSSTPALRIIMTALAILLLGTGLREACGEVFRSQPDLRVYCCTFG